MKIPTYLLALAALVASASLGATPAAAQGTAVPLDAKTTALYKRVVALNAGVRSYKADVHLDVALKTFPYISPSLDGNVYYKRPDKEAIVFDTVPALASQFKKVYPKVDPPSRWLALYDVGVIGTDDGSTVYRLVPKRNGRVEHLDVRVDDATATIKAYAWTYKDGGSVTFDQSYTSVGGAYLVEKQVGHVDFPTYKADVTSNFKNYRLNVAIADSIFVDK
ncbi:MAG: hypothetical protein NVS4B5_21780 [Vulcanimicrobiaceae bacterium]